jgi:SAM-dependent methyltransferase
MAEEPREKLFSRTEYRRVIAWPDRIEREAPFLDRVLATADRILDVGCGTGEHTRHFAEQGRLAVGIDLSEDMIAQASELAGKTASGGSARFELRPARTAAELPEAPFSGAICVGNTFAFLESERELAETLEGVAAALAPGAPFLVQLLNYERIELVPVRNLPVNFRPLPEEEGEGEIVFLRILSPRGDHTIDFFPITLTLKPDEDPPVCVRSARRGRHTAWKRPELTKALRAAGFGRIRALGGMSETRFDAGKSHDLVLIARRRRAAAVTPRGRRSSRPRR